MMFKTVFRPHEDEDTLDFAATQEQASLITHACYRKVKMSSLA